MMLSVPKGTLALVITHIDNDNDENDKHDDDEMICNDDKLYPMTPVMILMTVINAMVGST